MSQQVQHRRGTTAAIALITPALAEIFHDSTLNTLVTGDGSTAGGFALLRSDLSNRPSTLAKLDDTNIVYTGTGLITHTHSHYHKLGSRSLIDPLGAVASGTTTRNETSKPFSTMTIGGSVTLALTAATAGDVYVGQMILTQDGTGSRALTVSGTGLAWQTNAGVAFDFTTQAAAKQTVLTWQVDSAAALFWHSEFA